MKYVVIDEMTRLDPTIVGLITIREGKDTCIEFWNTLGNEILTKAYFDLVTQQGISNSPEMLEKLRKSHERLEEAKTEAEKYKAEVWKAALKKHGNKDGKIIVLCGKCKAKHKVEFGPGDVPLTCLQCFNKIDGAHELADKLQNEMTLGLGRSEVWSGLCKVIDIARSEWARTDDESKAEMRTLKAAEESRVEVENYRRAQEALDHWTKVIEDARNS